MYRHRKPEIVNRKLILGESATFEVEIIGYEGRNSIYTVMGVPEVEQEVVGKLKENWN